MKKILQTLTYRDGGGNHRLRDYIKVTLGIVVLVLALGAVSMYNRSRMLSEVMATPRPLDVGFMPASTAPVVAPDSPFENCPSDPADWTLTANVLVPGSNLKGLSPQCVYDQVDKTAAWFYATSVFGYGRRDAADLFGFSSMPMEYQFETGQIAVRTDLNDEPVKVGLRFPSDNTALKEWRIDSAGNPAVEFTFSGCFRTSSISGGEVVSWGDGYPIVCEYAGDFQTKNYVTDVGGKTLTISGSENVRRFMWFGYAGKGRWVLLGVAKDWEYDLTQIQNRGASTIDPSVMAQKYGISPLPLPEKWTVFTGQKNVDSFLKELDVSE